MVSALSAFAGLLPSVRAYVAAHPVRAGFISGVVGGVLATLISNAIWAIGITWFGGPESTVDIEQLIADEASLVRKGPSGAESYVALFTEDAQIVDAQGKEIFKGRDAIARRFQTLPAFDTLEHDLLASPSIHEDTATAATVSTIQFGDERHAGSELWMFVRVDGTWKIHRLRFNNPQ